MGPLVWRFKTCSVITCCRQMVLLDAFAPWFSWHQRLTCRQAAAFPGSDLGASELVVSSRVPKCLHRIGSFGPPKRGSKSKASNQAAFIGLSCTTTAQTPLRRLAHSIWDHSVLVLCFSSLCLRASSRGESRFRGGSCPGLVGFLLAFCDLGS